MKKVELLSPAGSIERLKIALLYGADAVYIGGRDYSLRANAKNFSLDEIIKSIEILNSLDDFFFSKTINEEQLRSYIRKTLMETIDEMNGNDFEYFCAALIKKEKQENDSAEKLEQYIDKCANI